MKIIALFVLCLVAGCSAGNLTINRAEPIRVSSCTMTDDAVVTYTQRGVIQTVAPSVAHFENTIISPVGSDLCTETGLLCPNKGE